MTDPKEQKVYTYPVPEGFPAMSMPVKPEDRMTAGEIEVGFWTEQDVYRIAEINYEGFPMMWWNKHEDESLPMPERIQRLAERCMAPVIKQKGMHGLKATVKATGEIVGMALWYANIHPGNCPTEYPDMPGVTFPSSFIPFVYRSTNPETLDWTRKNSWTETQRQQLWSHVRPSMNEEMTSYDKGRVEQMGEAYNWYIGPLSVAKDFRGRGVGKLLVQWGINMAEAMEPPVPVLLDAFPNARPVYYHLGFEDVQPKEGKENLMIRRPAA